MIKLRNGTSVNLNNVILPPAPIKLVSKFILFCVLYLGCNQIIIKSIM